MPHRRAPARPHAASSLFFAPRLLVPFLVRRSLARLEPGVRSTTRETQNVDIIVKSISFVSPLTFALAWFECRLALSYHLLDLSLPTPSCSSTTYRRRNLASTKSSHRDFRLIHHRPTRSHQLTLKPKKPEFSSSAQFATKCVTRLHRNSPDTTPKLISLLPKALAHLLQPKRREKTRSSLL